MGADGAADWEDCDRDSKELLLKVGRPTDTYTQNH